MGARQSIWRKFRLITGRLVRTAICLVAILGVALIIQQSEAFTNCIHNRKNNKQYQALRESSGIVIDTIVRGPVRFRLNYVCVWEFADKDSGGIVALATIALSAFTFTLWRSTNRLWQVSLIHSGHAERAIVVSEAAAQRQLRAYVFVVTGQVRWGGDAEATIIVRNYGMTPAYSIKIYAIFDSVESEIIFPKFEDNAIPLGVIAPHSQLRYTQRAEPTLDPNKTMLVWGEITYNDAFGNAQWTRYCLRTTGRGIELEPYDVGNDAS